MDGPVRTRSASVRPVRTRPGPSTRPWPVRTFSHLTHIYLLQTQAHSTDQVYWVSPTRVSYALVVTAAYHVGSSFANLNVATRRDQMRYWVRVDC